MNPPDISALVDCISSKGYNPRLSISECVQLLSSPDYGIFHFNNAYGGVLDYEFGGKMKSTMNNIKKENPDLNNEQVEILAVERIGAKNSVWGMNSLYAAVVVHKQFLSHMAVHEYDGKETPYFNETKYILDNMMQVLEEKGNITLEQANIIKDTAHQTPIFVGVNIVTTIVGPHG